MTLETPLPDGIQDRFEGAIRNVIVAASEADGRTMREVSVPETDGSVTVDLPPELESISVTSPADERVLRVELPFSPLPDTDVPLVPESFGPEVRDTLEFSVEEMVPTHLGDLGGDYTKLSRAVVDTLAEYCDALEEDPSIAFAGDRADLICARYLEEDRCLFAAEITYPEYVEYVYANGLCEQARRLGLPD